MKKRNLIAHIIVYAFSFLYSLYLIFPLPIAFFQEKNTLSLFAGILLLFSTLMMLAFENKTK